MCRFSPVFCRISPAAERGGKLLFETTCNLKKHTAVFLYGDSFAGRQTASP
ncbi:hypothetical protein HMPREF1141_2438 [Clostridium sp. MSTE9]|nr:hypothetical protein HMPREF1141_2438 [Clostridium sp. MSTE9]